MQIGVDDRGGRYTGSCTADIKVMPIPSFPRTLTRCLVRPALSVTPLGPALTGRAGSFRLGMEQVRGLEVCLAGSVRSSARRRR